MAVETMAAKAGESDSIEQPLAATCILTLKFSLLTVTQVSTSYAIFMIWLARANLFRT